MVDTATILKYAALALVIGGIGAVVFAVVWAIGTKLYDAMAPFFNVVDSILGSITAHPIAWIAAIGAAVLGVIGTYGAYKVYEHVQAQKEVGKSMKSTNEASKLAGESIKFTDDQIKAMDPVNDAKAAEYAATNGTYNDLVKAGKVDFADKQLIEPLQKEFTATQKALADVLQQQERAMKTYQRAIGQEGFDTAPIRAELARQSAIATDLVNNSVRAETRLIEEQARIVKKFKPITK